MMCNSSLLNGKGLLEIDRSATDEPIVLEDGVLW